MSEAFSAIIMVAALRLAESMVGITEASITLQPLQAVHAQLIVNHGQGIAGRGHAAGAGGMEGGGAALLGGAQQLVVGLHARTWKVLVVVIGLERLRLEQPPGEPHGGQQHAPVRFQRQVVGLDDRCLERIGRSQAHEAAAFGALLPGRDGHAGLALQLALHALPVAGRRERELDIGVRHRRIRAPEAVDMRRTQRQHALAREQPLGDLGGEP